MLGINGKRTVDSFHRELGQVMWDYCGMGRNAEGLRKAHRADPELRDEFWDNVKVPGVKEDLNQSLEKAGRVADFFELAELMCLDALHRNESCGGHFREEYQTPEGEALRDDEQLRVRRGVGDSRAPTAARCCTRSRSTSSTSIPRRGTTSESSRSRSGGRRIAATQGRAADATRPTTSARTCRSSRCSTSSTTS